MTRGDLHQRAENEGYTPFTMPTYKSSIELNKVALYVTWLEDIILKYVKADGTAVYHMECRCGNRIITPEKVTICSVCGRELEVA